jgi:hypothetical protein
MNGPCTYTSERGVDQITSLSSRKGIVICFEAVWALNANITSAVAKFAFGGVFDREYQRTKDRILSVAIADPSGSFQSSMRESRQVRLLIMIERWNIAFHSIHVVTCGEHWSSL